MLLDHAVLDMQAAGASRKLLDFVDQPRNLVSTPLARHKPLARATRIQVFSSYASIAKALANHHIAADTQAVVYDNERSTGTPAAELEDPVRYCQLTATLLHQHGLDYIASPGFDLPGPRPANGEVRVLTGSQYGFRSPDAISSDGTHVWVANRADSVTELDAATGAAVQVISGSSYGFGEPDAIASDGTDMWVANPGGESVTGFPA